MKHKLTIFNPIQDVLKNVGGVNAVGGIRNNLNFYGFCWDCQKTKPRKGGKVVNAFGKSSSSGGGPQRLTCAECLETRAARKDKRATQAVTNKACV